MLPVQEYRRDEGHVVKGLQRGAESFGLSTATAAVDMLQRMVGIVQVMFVRVFVFLTNLIISKPSRRRSTRMT